ncbi:MAG: hypothetical protein KDC87_21915, partial [Planctomycetes bacterium]|nr:hypothetical protein [Planctomycetota bacterium]
FKLAHLHFHGNQKILEVATFRSAPVANEPEVTDEESSEDDDLLIVHDNEFGTIEDDALRRDFTINALFHDPIRDEIIDYVGGIQDVHDEVIRTIGDPMIRFREDPIRILRAAKFAGRLGFHCDAPTEQAMRAAAPDLSRAAPPRMLEEILRLLRGGHALPSFQILHRVNALATLLPGVHAFLGKADDAQRLVFWRLLEALDNHIHNGGRPSSAVLLGCMFLLPVLQEVEVSGGSPAIVAEEVVGPVTVELRLPRRDTGALKRICAVHPRFTATGTRRFRLASFLNDPHMAEALELFELHCHATDSGFERLEEWRALVTTRRPEQTATAPAPEAAPPHRDTAERDAPRKDKKDKKRRKRKGRGDRDERREERSEQRVPERPAKGKKSKRKKRGGKGDGERRREDDVLTLEPEAVDLSAFDRELGHREVPRFDTIVDSSRGNAPRRRRQPLADHDSYRPPPPPGSSDAPPPPPSEPDTFGDW